MSHPLVNLYQIKLFYQFSGFTHVFQSWLKPAGFTTVPTGNWGDYDVATRTTNVDASVWLINFIDAYKPLFANTMAVNLAELWAYNAGSSNGIFLAAQGSSAVGTNVGANLLAGQTIFTGRTTTGRIKKLTAEENAVVPGLPVTWDAGGSGAFNTFGLWVMSSNGGVLVDREGAPVVALSQVFPGQNEATFKKRYRDV